MPDAEQPVDHPDDQPRVDYVFATPDHDRLYRLADTGETSTHQQLLEQVNHAAHTAHNATRQRDHLIRAAIAAGVDPELLAAATGLTAEQLHRINLTD